MEIVPAIPAILKSISPPPEISKSVFTVVDTAETGAGIFTAEGCEVGLG